MRMVRRVDNPQQIPRSCRAFCILLVCAVACVAADRAEPARPDGMDEALWRRLVALDAKSRKIVDLSARFTQSKHTLLLKKPIVSHGRVLVRGDRMVWHTTKPQQHSVLVTPQEVRVHYPKQKLLEIYRLQDRLADLAASPVPRLENMVRLFVIERPGTTPPQETIPSGDLRLKLTPRDEELKQHIESVVVDLDEATGAMKRFELTDSEGEKTIVTLSEIAINTDLDDEDVALKVPDGTQISRPLEGERE